MRLKVDNIHRINLERIDELYKLDNKIVYTYLKNPKQLHVLKEYSEAGKAEFVYNNILVQMHTTSRGEISLETIEGKWEKNSKNSTLHVIDKVKRNKFK